MGLNIFSLTKISGIEFFIVIIISIILLILSLPLIHIVSINILGVIL
jgi:hypothetical protein